MAKTERKEIRRADGSVILRGGYMAPKGKSNAQVYEPTIKAANLPKKVDLRQFMTHVEDQGEIGSCTANATAGAYEYLVKRNQEIDYDVSRLFLYYNARKINGLEKQDSGAFIEWAMQALEKEGACCEPTWPYENAKKRFKTKPDKDAYQEAKDYKIKEYKKVPTTLDAWRSVLAEGYPIIFGLTIFDSFMKPRQGRISMPKKGDGSEGGHAMLCVGYSDPDQVFIVRNSWGESWGDKGYCYIPYEYMMNKKYNDGDSWVIYSMDEVDPNKAEETWDNDDESLFVDYNDEFSNMSQEQWDAMCEELGDYDIVFRIGALYCLAMVGDEEVADEEFELARQKLKNIFKIFRIKYSAKKVLETCMDICGQDGFIEETIDVLGRYLSKGALATIAKDMYEIAAADGNLDPEEEELIDGLIGPWLDEDASAEYEDEYEDEEDEDDDWDDDEDEDDEGYDEDEDDEEYDEDEDDDEYDEDEDGEEYDEDEEDEDCCCGDEDEEDEEYDEDEEGEYEDEDGEEEDEDEEEEDDEDEDECCSRRRRR